MDDITSQIEQDMLKLEKISDQTHDIRQKVIDKLLIVVDNIEFRPNDDKPTVTEAKRCLVDTLLKAVNDVDSQRQNLIKIKQRKQADEQAEDSLKLISKNVVEFMKQINVTVNRSSDKSDNVSIDKELDDRAVLEDIEISDGELEMVGKTAKDIENVD